MDNLKGTILIIDDNKQILYLLDSILSMYDYFPVLAQSADEALTLLENLTRPPDLILCDIMMPGMNGYSLYKKISRDERFFDIPFVFLTAKSDPESIRYGKSLGIDDYIIKPFKEEDLIAIVEGKLAKRKLNYQIREELKKKITLELSQNLMAHDSISSYSKDSVFLLLIKWHDVLGPQPVDYFPKKIEQQIELDSLGVQIFQTIISVYGELKVTNPQGVPLFLENIGMACYIYIDAYEDFESLSQQIPFMLVVIAPRIDYIITKRMEEILAPYSNKIKNEEKWDIKKAWEEILTVLPIQGD